MPAQDDVSPFKIVIGKEKLAYHRGEEQKTLECELKMTSLQRKTIGVLVGMLRDNRLRDEQELKTLGENLWTILFDNDVGNELKGALRSDNTQLLRVELEFGDGQELLASWPWEYLYCPHVRGDDQSDFFLATRIRRFLLSRRLDLIPPPRPLRVERPPVKVLFVAPSPRDETEVAYKSVFEALEQLEKELGKELIQVTPLVTAHMEAGTVSGEAPSATYDNFKNMVEALQPHIIHFVGHGQCIPGGGGQIAFVLPDYKADWVRDSSLARDLMDFTETRLVFLQACESALPDPYQAISGVAMSLAHKNIPAVVAMQYKVKHDVASVFARAFYKALAELRPVDLAVQEGRRSINSRIGDWAERQAFGLPVLYMRKSGPLFPPEQRQRQAHRPIAGSVVASSPASECPFCGRPYTPSANFCGECAHPLICPDCKRPLTKEDRRACCSCGKSFVEAGKVRDGGPGWLVGTPSPPSATESEAVRELWPQV